MSLDARARAAAEGLDRSSGRVDPATGVAELGPSVKNHCAPAESGCPVLAIAIRPGGYVYPEPSSGIV